MAAIPASAQIRGIQGKVIDGEGQPVADAAIEATIVSLADADFAVRNNDQTWRARTNATGDYILTVPAAGAYVVTATKEGIGSDRIKVAVQRSGIVTANVTLWKTSCSYRHFSELRHGAARSASSERSPLAAGADLGLARLLGWLEAVQLHTPGCADAPAIEVGRWPLRELEMLLRDVRELVGFLQRTEGHRAEYSGRGGAQREQADFLRLRSPFHPRRTGARILRRPTAEIDMPFCDAGRCFMPISGSSCRGISTAILSSRTEAEKAGGRDRRISRSDGRFLTASCRHQGPTSRRFSGTARYLRTSSSKGNLAELAVHLNRARRVFPRNAELIFDSACLHHELSSPAIQASVEQVRASDVSVAVGSRISELQRAEQFFREGLALAPADVDARVRLGHTLGELGRHAEAAAELRTAIAAKPDRRRLYLAELFLGREEEALGRSAEARRRYEQAAELYPDAQSPRLALSRLARQTGDRASAQDVRCRASPLWRAVDRIRSMVGLFYEPHKDDAEVLMRRMRQIGR